MNIEKTHRGFEITYFKDRYGNDCSLQQSSLADNNESGTSAVWLGVGCDRMHLDRIQARWLINMLVRWLVTGSFREGKE